MRTKKFISFTLLILLILPFIGGFSWLHHKRHSIKEQVKHRIIAGIPPNKLTKLAFPANSQYDFVKKHKKEFEYKGEMYDVVSRKKINGKIIFLCWADNAETALNKKLHHLVDVTLSTDPLQSHSSDMVISFVKNLYFNEPFQYDLFQNINRKIKTFHFQNYLDISILIDTPPPKFC